MVDTAMVNTEMVDGWRANSASGQAMIEACLSLALLSFVWILVMFSTYMGNNHIRTAMAARHAAWMKGNGGNPTPEVIAADFFFVGGSDVVDVDVQGGRGTIVGFITGDDDQDYGGKGNSHWVEVTFSMSAGSLAGTDVFPFSLMNSQLPFMPPSALEDFYQVKSHCQWDDVSETWSDWQEALEGVWDLIISAIAAISGVVAGLVDFLFGWLFS